MHIPLPGRVNQIGLDVKRSHGLVYDPLVPRGCIGREAGQCFLLFRL